MKTQTELFTHVSGVISEHILKGENTLTNEKFTLLTIKLSKSHNELVAINGVWTASDGSHWVRHYQTINYDSVKTYSDSKIRQASVPFYFLTLRRCEN